MRNIPGYRNKYMGDGGIAFGTRSPVTTLLWNIILVPSVAPCYYVNMPTIVLRHIPNAFPLKARERDRDAWRVVSVTGSIAFQPGDVIRRKQLNILQRNGWEIEVI